jgi:uncharacterized protein (DUF58 family)
MSTGNRGYPFGQSLSLTSILAVVVSFGMLVSYWKFHLYFGDWSRTVQIIYFAITFSLLFWGVNAQLSGRTESPQSLSKFGWTRYRVTLPRPGIIYLIILVTVFIGAAVGHSNMLVFVFALLVGPFLVNGVITLSMLTRLRVRRSAPKLAMAGEPISVRLTLANRKLVLSSWLMTVSDLISGANTFGTTGVLFPRVHPRGRRSGSYRLLLARRGRYSFGPIYVSTRFPLGLVERGRMINQRDEILVHPRLGKLSSSWTREWFGATEAVAHRKLRRGAYDDEFHHLREFRSGDNPRAIHWRTTARQNEIMVREFRQSRGLDLTVLVDLWQPDEPDDRQYERAELAVSLAATICVEQMKQSRNANVFLAIAGKKLTFCDRASTQAGIERLLAALAVVEAGSAPPIGELVELGTAKRSRSTETILITSRQREDVYREEAQAVGSSFAMTELAGDANVIETDPTQLAKFFKLE